MIAGLRGTLLEVAPDAVLIDVHGVVYRVGTSSSTLQALGGVGADAYLHTRLIVREDQMALFGFATRDEAALFDVLLGVTGIGPRIACGVLSTFSPERLHAAIASEDVALLATAPGIGRKTAARLILDLKGKLPPIGGGPAAAAGDATTPAAVDGEVVEALRALGYSAAEANGALAKLGPAGGQTVEERIVAALRAIGS